MIENVRAPLSKPWTIAFLFLPPRNKSETQDAVLRPAFRRSLQERNHTLRCIVEKILAINLGIRFILGMMIRIQNAGSKLCMVRPCHATRSCLRHLSPLNLQRGTPPFDLK